LLLDANIFFNEKSWDQAKQLYETALNLFPQDKSIKNKIITCINEIKVKEDAFKNFLFDATVSEKKGNLNEALAFLESAAKIKLDDTDVRSRIKKIKFSLGFETNGSTKSNPIPLPDSDIDFLPKKKKKSDNDETGFLSSSAKQKNNEDDILIKKNTENKDDEDDFLHLNKIKVKEKDKRDDDFLHLNRK
jgi:tetratricopeptide (TPR) repeat protein